MGSKRGAGGDIPGDEESVKGPKLGKIVQFRRWIFVAICCALAAAFHLGLTQYAARTAIAYCGRGPTTAQGPKSDPIIQSRSVVSDTFCMSPAAPGERAIASFYMQAGLFPRDGISAPIAVGAGIVLPLLLVCLAGYFALGAAQGRIRTGLAAGALLGGLLLTGPLLLANYRAWRGQYWQWMLQDSQTIIHLSLFTVPAAILLVAGVWLWRTRSPK